MQKITKFDPFLAEIGDKSRHTSFLDRRESVEVRRLMKKKQFQFQPRCPYSSTQRDARALHD